MYTTPGYYSFGEEKVWVQYIPKWGGIYYWTQDDGWQVLNEDQEEEISYWGLTR